MDGKVFGNRYELINKIGSGGMAIVYKAKDILLNRLVAVKILREEFKENEDFIRRFNIESQASASLSHQNIAQIYDVGEEEGMHYIVMEYLEGKTLKQYINECGGILSWREAANFSIQICRALEHAHSKHVVHRDIKPQNIILTDGNKLKVADFGIARAANNSTTVNTAVGSAHYLSPEQARGGYTDHRSDIYSLGVVMYEMFTGVLPFDGENDLGVVMKHLEDDAPLPSSINPDIPYGIEAIILRCMTKEQRLRYENASEILEDLVMVYQTPNIDPRELNAVSGETETEVVKRDKPPISPAVRKKRVAKKKKKKQGGLIAAISVIAAIFLAIIIFGVYLLFFSTGGEVQIPNLIGETYESAALIADEASTKDVIFDVIVDRAEHSDEPKDTIISQIPEEGSSVKRSREIKVVVSLGPVVVIMEDYTGKDFDKINEELTKKGIKVIKEEKESDTHPENTIFRQIPSEGTELAEGDEVTLYVSTGTENTVVPDVVGSSLDEAIVAIERNNLKVGIVREQPKDGVNKGKIFKQSVKAFETVPVNTSVDLYISNGEKEESSDVTTEDPSQTGENIPQDEKKNVKITLNNLPQTKDKVNIRLVLDGSTYYEKDFPTAPGSATITVETTESLSLDVYYDGVYITTKEVAY
ncbi:MAG: Stk1 family PASTA domain-containing Ser/Thr kinase [Clostridia bacterium]|nr:Stk1 family PASTA domain-containing Ser/Thr kinase [Clostridia bacterium]